MQLEKEKRQQYFMMGLVLYAMFVFISLHYCQVHVTYGYDLFLSITGALDHITSHPFQLGAAFTHPMELFKTLGIMSLVFWILFLYAYTEAQRKNHADTRTAKGDAQFNKDYKGFRKKFALEKAGPDAPDKNIILAKDVVYGLKEGRNTNVTIIGSAGSGKSFTVIKPNLMQMNSSYVVTDPSGEIFRAEAKLLMENGYDVKIFSTSSMLHSNCYNPFDYVYDEDGNVDETRVSSMIAMFLKNAGNMEEAKAASGDKFWDQAAKALLHALAMYLLEFCPPEMHNMYEMLVLVQKGKQNENDRGGDGQTELGRIFEKARKKNKDAHCFSSYDTFNLAPARTANSILISAGVDLNMFNQDKVRNMTTTSYKVQARSIDGKIRSFCRDSDGHLIRDDDNLDIRTIGDRKTCIFINIPQADPTYNFLVSMLYSQMFEALYGRAEKICPRKYMVINKYGDPILSMIDSEEDAVRLIKLYKDAKVKKIKEHGQDMFYITNSSAPKRFWIPGSKGGKLQKVYSEKSGQKYLKEFDDAKIVQGKGKLPWHVQCLLDEFSNIGSIPSFPQKLATMRKYEISCMIVLQSIAQLKNKYDKLYSDILSNCDCTIFLGSSDPETCKYVSDRLGKKTIIVKQHSYSSKGSNTGYNVSDRELLTVEEVSRLDNAKSIVMVNGERPFLATKYKALDHPNWKKTGDVDAKQQLEAADFTTCQEKALSIHGDAYATMNALLNAIGGTDEKGKGVMGQEQTVTSPVDAVNKAGGNVSNIAEAADAVQPVQGNFDMLSLVDMEDDLPPVQPSIPVGSDIPRRGAHDHSGKGSGGNTGKSAASVVSRRSAPEA